VRKPKLGVNARGHEPLLSFVRFGGRCAGQCIFRAIMAQLCGLFASCDLATDVDRPPPYFRVV
jgi:hypothetical protein